MILVLFSGIHITSIGKFQNYFFKFSLITGALDM